MRFMMLATGLLLGMAMMAAGQTASQKTVPAGDAALTYQWVHSNTQPGDCGCLGLNGGGLSGSWNVSSHVAAVAEVSGGVATNGPGTGNTLTLVSYMIGGRYTLPQLAWPHGVHGLKPLQPFAQVLVGVAHAGGGIAGAGDSNTEFAARVGGGLDLPISKHFAVRVAQVDYYPTLFKNMSNDHQNNLLVAGGVVYRWSRKK